MVKKENFILYWKKDLKVYQRNMNTENVVATFEGLAKGFSDYDNNEISKKIVEAINLGVTHMYINWDENQKHRKIYYASKENAVKSITIPQNHKIVLAILKEFSVGGENVPAEEIRKSFAL